MSERHLLGGLTARHYLVAFPVALVSLPVFVIGFVCFLLANSFTNGFNKALDVSRWLFKGERNGG